MNPPSEPWPVVVTTFTAPDAPAPTKALIDVEERTVKLLAFTPPKLTDVAPVKFKPVIITWLPVAAVVGVNELTITGG